MLELPLGWNPKRRRGSGLYESVESAEARRRSLRVLTNQTGVLLAAGWCRHAQADFNNLYPDGSHRLQSCHRFAERYGHGVTSAILETDAHEHMVVMNQLARQARQYEVAHRNANVPVEIAHAVAHVMRAMYRRRNDLGNRLEVPQDASLAEAADDIASGIVESYFQVIPRSSRERAEQWTWKWLWATYSHAVGPVLTFDPRWRTQTAILLAEGICDERAYDRTPILADALQDAGCDNESILKHLQGGHDEWTCADWVLRNLYRKPPSPALVRVKRDDE